MADPTLAQAQDLIDKGEPVTDSLVAALHADAEENPEADDAYKAWIETRSKP